MNAGISRFFNWIIVLLGILEIISPFFLGIASFPAVVNSLVVGLIVVILGVCAAVVNRARTARTLDFIIALLGAWLIVLPFILGNANVANGLLSSPIWIGIVVLILALLAALRNNREVYPVEQAAVYGRGSGMGTEIRTPEAAVVAEPPSAVGGPAGAQTTQPEDHPRSGDYQGSDTTTRGGETGQPAAESQKEGPRSDQDILNDVVACLKQEEHLNAANIHVSVKQGDVVLYGYVPTAVEQRMAGEVAGKVKGVQNVHNDLHVGEDVEAQSS